MRKKYILGGVFVILILSGLILFKMGFISPNGIIEYMHLHPRSAPIVFVITYMALLILALPVGLIMTLGAGVVWGSFIGGVLATIGATLGAAFSFTIGRKVASNYIHTKFNNKIFKKFCNEIDRGGWRSIVLARLSQVIPFGVQNYLFGITSIPFRIFILTTLLVTIPSALIVASVGNAAGGLVISDDAQTRLNSVVFGSIAIALLIALQYGIKRYRNKSVTS